MGGGEGRQKGRTIFFFFYILHREGCLRAGVPPGPLSGDHACPGALSPSSGGPCTSCPQEGSNPPQAGRRGRQVTGRGLASPFMGGPGPLLSKGDGTLGISAHTGSQGRCGLANPTPPGLREGGRRGAGQRPCTLLWGGSLLRAQTVTVTPQVLWALSRRGLPQARPVATGLPEPQGLPLSYRNLPSPFLAWRPPGSPASGPSPRRGTGVGLPRSSPASQGGHRGPRSMASEGTASQGPAGTTSQVPALLCPALPQAATPNSRLRAPRARAHGLCGAAACGSEPPAPPSPGGHITHMPAGQPRGGTEHWSREAAPSGPPAGAAARR